jgi:undecaprenyl-diphosphatase
MLAITMFVRNNTRKIGFLDAFIIGVAQALAVLPGISRSGATISTGLVIGNKRELITRFSFLMVLIPIIGANMQSLMSADLSESSGVGIIPLVVGFLAAFVSGLFACKWMIRIVNKGKLIYFAIYTFIIGSVAIIIGLL